MDLVVTCSSSRERSAPPTSQRAGAGCRGPGAARTIGYTLCMVAMRTTLVTLAACSLLAACGGQTLAGGSAGSGGQSTGGSGGAGGASCTTHYYSNLPGVSIRFPDSQRCVFSLAEAKAGIDFHYTVIILKPVYGVMPVPPDAGGCAAPGPGGLYAGEQIGGNGQSYCLCDTGLCPPPPTTSGTLQPGTNPATFSWPGVNWSGPSDTGNPYGPPFPPGSYQLTVQAHGSQITPDQPLPYSVSAVLDFKLTP